MSESGLRIIAVGVAVLLVGWVLLQLLVEVWVWLRARRHARAMPGCVGCGSVEVAQVAYPTRTDPRPYCMPCLYAWPEDGPQPPPMVELAHPFDPVDLLQHALTGLFAVMTAVVLIAWAVRS